ncbi:hypothetical protein ACFO26_09425 [Lactococcus nasutitermitis]|uniref:Uncharacterized protein n=1 Tax=Lactococcus nasutitermitis TaxID=1652957 RepID=A0ABV9JGP5_9LACT|nr:hypothetical protein [Lactococcus nasutitermitis]
MKIIRNLLFILYGILLYAMLVLFSISTVLALTGKKPLDIPAHFYPLMIELCLGIAILLSLLFIYFGRKNEPQSNTKLALVVKCTMILFFLGGWLLGLVFDTESALVGLFMIIFAGIFGPILGGVGIFAIGLISVILGEIFILPSSLYSWYGLRALRKTGKLNKAVYAILSILNFVLVADVVIAIVTHVLVKNRKVEI